ncbi:MAG: class I SAM-dependent methyltransferase [bacterium]|nr:class I SAM-dependent methyltransferase [bacterium]
MKRETPPDWYYQSIKIDFLQRIWHKRRFTEVSGIIEPVAGKVLDVGSADGTFSKIILDKSKASQFIGMEVLENSVNWAKKHWKTESRMKFIVGDAHRLKFKNNSFDAVFILEVLEHVEDPVKVLFEVKRILKKGGYGIFLVPSDSILFQLVWYLWLRFYPRGWVWKDTHIQTFRGNYLTKAVKNAGLTIEVNKKFNLGMLHLIKARK